MLFEPATPSPHFHLDPMRIDEVNAAIAQREDADSLPVLTLHHVEAGSDALAALPSLIRDIAVHGSSSVLLVQGRKPFVRVGADLKPMVHKQLVDAGFDVELLEIGDEHGYLHSDFAEVEQIRLHLRYDKTAIALGSGKICDVTKHACFEYEQETGLHIPFIVVQTANSVIAFGSGMATITKDGVKRTWPSRLPDTLLLDARILRDAPFEYTVGGVGDLSVIAVSFGDWSLGARLGMATYVPAAYDVLEDVRRLLFSEASMFAARDEDGMITLGKLGILGGFAMTLSGQSSPMSGYEHVMSHMLDMVADHFHRPVASHGCQCGLSTIVSAIAWQKLLAEFQPERVNIDTCFPSSKEMQQRIQATFDEIDPSGAASNECWQSYRKKLEKWQQARARFEAFLHNWSQERSQLAELLTAPEAIVQGLAQAHHPLRYEDIGVPEQQVRWAFKNGHLMRDRFSIADVLNYTGLLDDTFVDDVFTRMHELVANALGQKSVSG